MYGLEFFVTVTRHVLGEQWVGVVEAIRRIQEKMNSGLVEYTEGKRICDTLQSMARDLKERIAQLRREERREDEDWRYESEVAGAELEEALGAASEDVRHEGVGDGF